MGIKWNPKISQFLSKNDLHEARTQARESQKHPNSSMEAPSGAPKAPDSADLRSPSLQEGLPPPSHLGHLPELAEKELARLKSALSSSKNQAATLRQTREWVLSYTNRRSRAGRRTNSDLLNLALESASSDEYHLEVLRDVLLAESELNELTIPNTWNSALLLLPYVTVEGPWQARAQALLARTFTQLALHFPNELSEDELSIPNALEQAFYLAEAAANSEPDLPDGHAALARLLLIQTGSEALEDAISLFELALSIDPDFDPARLGLAAALFAQEDLPGALDHIETLSNQGSPYPGLFSLRAQLKARTGDFAIALRDAERATQLAPEAGLFWLDAAQVAQLSGKPEAAQRYSDKAAQLLGEYYQLALGSL